MPTTCCLVAPPCTPVLLIVCRRQLLPSLLPPSRSRSLLPLSVNTPSGSAAPSLPPSPPSSPCGSPRRNTTSLAPESSTASASKNLFSTFIFYLVHCFVSFRFQ